MPARLAPPDMHPAGVVAGTRADARQKPLRTAPQLRVARHIADCLGETGHGPIEQLVRLVRCVGPERAGQFLEHTLSLEATGRLLRPAYARDASRATIFFHLVHESVEAGDHAQIFGTRRPRKSLSRQECP